MARLTKNVAVRRDGNPVVLKAGDEAPDWAVDLLDDNVLEGGEMVVKDRLATDSELVEALESYGVDDAEGEVARSKPARPRRRKEG